MRGDYLEHPVGIENGHDFLARIAVQFGLGYLDDIEHTTDPNRAAELARDAAHWARDTKSERAKEIVEACIKAAIAKSREVDAPPPHGPDDYGVTRTPQDEEELPPRVVCPTIFFGTDPPPRRWIVPDWIPYGAVTGLYGEGGLGKSLLSQQLQTGTALGTTWLGLPVEQSVSLGVYCEDDEDELRRRQRDINADYGVDLGRLENVFWMSRLGEDNILMTYARTGVAKLTKFHAEVMQAALDFKARLVIIDAAADAFGGDENNRGHVRQFVQRALGLIALKIDGAVLCTAHPSRAGISSGTGDSGSTGWSAAFRSRLSMGAPKAEAGEPPDPNARILERKKANYASRGDTLRLRWHNGVIIPDWASTAGMTTFGRVEARTVFLDLVREMDGQNRPVSSSSRASNYAPREFEKLPTEQRYGFRKADFERAMNALFKDRKIKNVPYGRKGDERTKIAVCGDSEPA
jgi:RecA-family ATPase